MKNRKSYTERLHDCFVEAKFECLVSHSFGGIAKQETLKALSSLEENVALLIDNIIREERTKFMKANGWDIWILIEIRAGQFYDMKVFIGDREAKEEAEATRDKWQKTAFDQEYASEQMIYLRSLTILGEDKVGTFDEMLKEKQHV